MAILSAISHMLAITKTNSYCIRTLW